MPRAQTLVLHVVRLKTVLYCIFDIQDILLSHRIISATSLRPCQVEGALAANGYFQDATWHNMKVFHQLFSDVFVIEMHPYRFQNVFHVPQKASWLNRAPTEVILLGASLQQTSIRFGDGRACSVRAANYDQAQVWQELLS